MLTLLEVLEGRTCRLLKAMANAHQLPLNTKLPKTDQIRHLYDVLGQTKALQRAFKKLSAEGVVALQTLQAAEGCLPHHIFSRRFGVIRPYRPWREDAPRCPWRHPISIAEKLYYLGMIEIRGKGYMTDVHLTIEMLDQLPPLPRPQSVDISVEVPITPDEFRYDLAIFLSVLLAEDVKLMWGRWLSPNILKRIHQGLAKQDVLGRSELQTPRIRLIHYMASVAGLVSVQHGYLKPTVEAWRWLASSPEHQWQHLLGAWTKDLQRHHSVWEDFRFTSLSRLIYPILLERLTTLTTETAFHMTSFLESLVPYLHGDETCLPAINQFMIESLLEMGMIGKTASTLVLPKQGKACLQGHPHSPTVENAHLEIEYRRWWVHLPRYPRLHPLVELLSFAHRDGYGVWIDQSAVQKAIRFGYGVLQIADILAELCGKQLPMEILDTLRSWEQDARRLVVRHMTVLTSSDSQLLADIRSDRHLRPMVRETLSAHHIALEPHEADHLCQRLAKRGLPITYHPTFPDSVRASDELPSTLADYLWIAVHTYRELQKIITLDIPMPAHVQMWIEEHLSQQRPSELKQVVEDLSEAIGQAIEGYAPSYSPVTQDDPQTIRKVVEAAIQDQQSLTIEYLSPAQGKPIRRIIEPLLPIVYHHGAAYLEAWCQLEQAPRTFRLDRIVQVVSVEAHSVRDQVLAGELAPHPAYAV